MTVIWEHGHAYQPRRILDAVTSESREIENGLSIRFAETAKRARNWFELMLAPGSVYDLLIEALDTRSIDIEPLTLLYLKKLNPLIFEELRRRIRHGNASVFPCPFSHPILPLLVKKSRLDTEVNLNWTLQLTFAILGRPSDKRVFLWLPECAYSQEVAQAIVKVARAIRSEMQVFLLLDEFQGQDVEPSQPHKVNLGQETAYAVFRSRWLSDAYAFSSDAEWVIHSIRSDIGHRNPRLLGTMIDAETYGGAYGPHKTAFFKRIREGVDGNVDTEGRRIPVEFAPVDQAVMLPEVVSEVRLFDGSSWSDYASSQLLNLQTANITGIVASNVGFLCRWTGFIPKSRLKRDETYFLVFEWTDPNSRKQYSRVLSSLWKVAFNTLRDETTELVRSAVLEMLPEIAVSVPVEKILLDYWQMILDDASWKDFAEKIGTRDGDPKSRIALLLLEAYRMANQESIMSDPTYWENIDTEVTWTSLALLASSIISVAKAAKALGRREWQEKCAEAYSSIFLNFERRFSTLWREYDHPIGQLYQLLAHRSKAKGFDLERELATAPLNIQSARVIATKAYRLAFEQAQKEVYEHDVNPFIILWKMYEARGQKKEAASHLEQSIVFEWQKSIGSAVSDRPIPVRVGLLHIKHFSDKEEFGFIETKVETKTEIIGGEAHAYTERQPPTKETGDAQKPS